MSGKGTEVLDMSRHLKVESMRSGISTNKKKMGKQRSKISMNLLDDHRISAAETGLSS